MALPLHPTVASLRVDNTAPSTEQWADVFGPAAYSIPDHNRNRKYGRIHLPQVLHGSNQWITDRVDGLITDATKSPFTTLLLPYKHIDTPDGKIEWNVWTFDQGLATRVPYESAARTLTQRKQSFSGYTVRQGLAITMEHNFMMSKEGMQNFQNQIMQVVGSIQNTNDLDVHMALLTAPSYLSNVRERYYLDEYLSKSMRDYIDMFGFVQKNMNAMDILIEETKSLITGWGGEQPDFMLCSNKLCFQLTMTQERTSYYVHGDDGKKLLKEGPMLHKYRQLNVIKSKCFSLEEGSAPRDIMRRRVRVCEYYLGKPEQTVALYDESSDNFHTISWDTIKNSTFTDGTRHSCVPQECAPESPEEVKSIMLIRPNIEHYMLGLIIGKGGIEHLGATLWGQTEMSVFDDGQHGVWGMTYKYHERAIVFNERNMHRVWDIAYDGYCGGKDISMFKWTDNDIRSFIKESTNVSKDYEGKSIVPIFFKHDFDWLPSPIPVYMQDVDDLMHLVTPDLIVNDSLHLRMQFESKIDEQEKSEDVLKAVGAVFMKLQLCTSHTHTKLASEAVSVNETTACRMMYQGTSTWTTKTEAGQTSTITVYGCGHHGSDYVGVASVRNGKSLMASAAPNISVNASSHAQIVPVQRS